jgi:hypothetical protein
MSNIFSSFHPAENLSLLYKREGHRLYCNRFSAAIQLLKVSGFSRQIIYGNL